MILRMILRMLLQNDTENEAENDAEEWKEVVHPTNLSRDIVLKSL